MEPNFDLGRRFLAARPPPGTTLLCAVTGSHLYGFASPDSDLDLKGIHLAPTRSVLGLSTPSEAHDRLEVFEGVECDLTTHEAGVAMTLLLKGNGNMIERIMSPLQLVDTPHVAQLQQLVPRALSRSCYGHYRGFLRGMQREHTRQPRLKSLLYTFRVGLTGVHLLKTGQVVSHLPTLAEAYGFDALLDLMAAKSAGPEAAAVHADAGAAAQGRWGDLEALLDEARATSVLPEEPPDRDACEAWLVNLRVSELS